MNPNHKLSFAGAARWGRLALAPAAQAVAVAA